MQLVKISEVVDIFTETFQFPSWKYKTNFRKKFLKIQDFLQKLILQNIVFLDFYKNLNGSR